MTDSPEETELLTVNGVSHTRREWSEINNIPYATLCARINRGWPLEKAVSAPVRMTPKKKEIKKALATGRPVGSLGPARQLKHQFLNTISTALAELGEAEQIRIIQQAYKENPVQFLKNIVVPLIPKDEYDPKAQSPGAAQIHVEFNGSHFPNPVINPVIDVEVNED